MPRPYLSHLHLFFFLPQAGLQHVQLNRGHVTDWLTDFWAKNSLSRFGCPSSDVKAVFVCFFKLGAVKLEHRTITTSKTGL